MTHQVTDMKAIGFIFTILLIILIFGCSNHGIKQSDSIKVEGNSSNIQMNSNYRYTNKICGSNGSICMTLVDSIYKFTILIDDHLTSGENSIDSIKVKLEILGSPGVYNSCCSDIFLVNESVIYESEIPFDQIKIRIDLPKGFNKGSILNIDKYKVEFKNITMKPYCMSKDFLFMDSCIELNRFLG